jgi:hypothetical protein
LGEIYRDVTEKLIVSLGTGKVIYFPQPVYPIDPTIRDAYTGAMVEAAVEANAAQWERGWIIPDNRIGFTAWNNDNRRTLYLLNVDWKSGEESHPAVLKYGSSSFTINARRGALETIHCAEGLAIMPGSNTTDVLDITKQADGWHVKVQTTEADTLRIFNAATGRDGEKALDGPGIHRFDVE